MTRKRVVAIVSMLAGAHLLALGAISVALVYYYRPTIEYAYDADGQPLPVPSWLTGELIVGVFASVLGIFGGLLLWAGRRWRRA